MILDWEEAIILKIDPDDPHFSSRYFEIGVREGFIFLMNGKATEGVSSNNVERVDLSGGEVKVLGSEADQKSYLELSMSFPCRGVARSFDDLIKLVPVDRAKEMIVEHPNPSNLPVSEFADIVEWKI